MNFWRAILSESFSPFAWLLLGVALAHFAYEPNAFAWGGLALAILVCVSGVLRVAKARKTFYKVQSYGALTASNLGVFNVLQRRAWWFALAAFIVLGALAATMIALTHSIWPTVFFMAAVGVAASPLGVPSRLMSILAADSQKLQRQKSVVRGLLTLEKLAQTKTILADKTHLCTLGNLTAQVVWVPERKAKKGADLKGEHVLLKGVSFEASKRRLMRRIAMVGLLCNEVKFEGNKPVGNAVDTALARFGTRMMLSQSTLLRHFPQVHRIAFTSDKQYAASVHNWRGQNLLAVKGAPEVIANLCQYENPKTAPWWSEVRNLAEGGYKVVAFAGGPTTAEATTALQLTPDHTKKLTFLGLVAFIDPLRPEAAAAILKCEKAGIDVALLTGDLPTTALVAAKELGLAGRREEVVSGFDLQNLNPTGEAFAALAVKGKVFARITPLQKQQITAARMAHDPHVLVTGNAATDLPALRQAYVGVATSKEALAPDAADLVLDAPSFETLTKAVFQGRKTLKAMRVFAGLAFAIAGVVLLGAIGLAAWALKTGQTLEAEWALYALGLAGAIFIAQEALKAVVRKL